MVEDVEHARVDAVEDLEEGVRVDGEGGRVQLLAELVHVREEDEALGDLLGERAQLGLLRHQGLTRRVEGVALVAHELVLLAELVKLIETLVDLNINTQSKIISRKSREIKL